MTATDLVLTVTELLRKRKVVGKFVEFFGPGTESLAVPDRATIANMAPEYGATMGFFPVDERTIEYFKGTGRTEAEIEAFEAYFKAQGLFGIPRAGEIDYSTVVTLDLTNVAPSLAGPKRPQDRIEIGNVKKQFTSLFSKPPADNGFNQPIDKLGKRFAISQRRQRATRLLDGRPTLRAAGGRDGGQSADLETAHAAPQHAAAVTIGNGDVLIAAITSCTNTSNPGVLLAAGLLAKKAVQAGLKVPAAREDLAGTGLAHRHRVPHQGRAAAVPRASSASRWPRTAAPPASATPGDLAPEFNEADHRQRPHLRRGAVGQPQLRGAHPSEPEGQLPGQPAAGGGLRDRRHRAARPDDRAGGSGTNGRDVFLGDIWPTSDEVHALMKFAMNPQGLPGQLRQGARPSRASCGARSRACRARSTTGRPAPTSPSRRSSTAFTMQPAVRQRARRDRRTHHWPVRRLDHHRPHLAGGLDQGQRRRPASTCSRNGVLEARLQQLRFSPRQPRGDDARHLRQRAHQEPDDAAGR